MSKIELKNISDLLGKEFFVPVYQRGYKWKKQEVTALFNDINDFKKTNDTNHTYLLQPIVVVPLEDNKWEVVDGQQRLTTIYLLLKNLQSYSKPELFDLTYQSRKGSNEYLKSINADQKNDNSDFFHIYDANAVLAYCLKDNNEKFKQDYLNYLKEHVQVIWYEVDKNEVNSIELFTRINIGKIPLTNAELIKALLLNKANFLNKDVNLKSEIIALEWDVIEQKLQDKSFWYFVNENNKNDVLVNRIERLFELIYKLNSGNKGLFVYFNEQLKDGKIDDVWSEIKTTFQIIEEWYNNSELFNFISFLFESKNKTLVEVLDNYFKSENKKNFFNSIKNIIIKDVLIENKITRQQKVESFNISYSDKNIKNNKNIKNILLLFNIVTMMNNKTVSNKFPFFEYGDTAWDIEHIFPQKEPEISIEKEEWLKNLIELETDKEINHDNNSSNELVDKLKKIYKKVIENPNQGDNQSEEDSEQFTQVFAEVIEKYENKFTKEEMKNGICNLTLLNARINRSYKNAIFAIKRKTIIENDRLGTYIPVCTKNLFLKYYSNKLGDSITWSEYDANAYKNELFAQLVNYFYFREDKND